MNKQSNHINDDLLVKHLLGIDTPSEKAAVTTWLAEKEEHRRYFEHFRLIWEESRKLAAVSTVNENDAWSRFQQRVGTNENTTRIVKLDTGISWRPILRIAAVLIILAGAAGAWFISQQRNQPLILASGEQIKQDVLPDGSQITLNKQSRITYAGNRKERQVKLEGEAFFNVAQDPGKPFVIKVNEVTVTVLGTSFNVKSTAGKTEVIVETGAVEVTKNNNSVQLKQHEKAIVTATEKAPVKQSNTDELYSYYRTQTFVCNDTPLWKLVEILNEAYGVNIVIANPEKRNLQINSTFTNSSLDSTLQVIGLTYEIAVEKQGSQIILK
ncbi:FecR family protein [Chitinophaga arvensicola]|uniref:Ferric-dicitrate binding protein FerR, regulates iron transport through sigma-19 n=1 Tax=Chitinophaga arvensicola TaxID=29529 RepID=A0A1I0SBS9_9BACT|nr:FecR domain-containing protein [Chitinophaga arvensicola]SEW54418.1 ferric-dicitrate binding protein FerR, regulates iron transport through sigma-19 [Chitinophaga arvensicola]